jgi:hypothetical protein
MGNLKVIDFLVFLVPFFYGELNQSIFLLCMVNIKSHIIMIAELTSWKSNGSKILIFLPIQKHLDNTSPKTLSDIR